MPTEAMLTWIILNLGVGWMLLRYVKEKDGDEDDMIHRTYFEGMWNAKASEIKVQKEMSGVMTTNAAAKETYKLDTEYVKQVKYQGTEHDGLSRSRPITFSSGEEDESEVLTAKRRKEGPTGKVSFIDFSESEEEVSGEVRKLQENIISEDAVDETALGEQKFSGDQLKNLDKDMAEDMKSETLEIGEVNRNKAIILEDDIEEKHEEHLPKKGELVNIFVKSTEGRTVVVQMLLEETTGKLKTMVLEKSGALNGNMRLEYGGKVLKDEFSLWEYNIRENSTIFAFTAGIGGTKSPTKSKKENEKMEIEKTPVKNLKAKTASKGCENLTEVEKPIDFGYDKFKENDLEFRQAQLKIKDSEMYRIQTDGASRGNPGPASVGYVISDSAGNELYGNAMSVDEGTNNMAEYLGVIFGLRSVINLGIKRISVYCDSELVVNQVNGKYKVVNEEMKAYCEEVKSLLKELRECEVKWIPRGENLRANQLAQEILNTNGTKLNTGTKKIGAKLTQVPQLEQTKMQEEDKIEKDNGTTPTKGGTKQQRLDNFLKRSSKESKPVQSVSQNNMLEELTEESHQQIDEKKLGPVLPNERSNGTTEKEHPQLIICQGAFGGSKERVEDICAQYILRIAAQLPKNDEVVRAQNLRAPLLKSQLADGMVTESNISIFAKEKIDRICEH